MRSTRQLCSEQGVCGADHSSLIRYFIWPRRCHCSSQVFLSGQILGQQINDFTLPDVNLIAEHSDAAELGRMLQLILGCAVNCEQKQGNVFEVSACI